MQGMKRWSVLSIILVLGACATTSANGGRDPIYFGRASWTAAVIERGLDPADVIYPFDVTPDMEAWARSVTERDTGTVSRLNKLQAALFEPDGFPFSYDQRVTLPGKQAFSERRGNCLAFTSMFVSLARSIGLPGFLVMVQRTPTVERDEDIVVVNRHVVAGYSEASRLYLFDFYEKSETPYIQTRVIDDLAASALFHTNFGGDAIREGDAERAELNFRIATRLGPELAAPWIGLGVIQFRKGRLDDALDAYRHALEAEPGNPSALTNLAHLYRRQGLEDQASAALRAAGKGSSSPYTLIALADSELAQGDVRQARHYLRKARHNYRNEPEVWEALARLETALGDHSAATRYRDRARVLRALADG